jgi:hypothetical protein
MYAKKVSNNSINYVGKAGMVDPEIKNIERLAKSRVFFYVKIFSFLGREKKSNQANKKWLFYWDIRNPFSNLAKKNM